MNTSNYDTRGAHPNAVSIAGRCHDGYHGREYKKLAPKWGFFSKYKQDGDEEAYTRAYVDEVLSVLDPQEVYDELGEDAILLCWEPSGLFCHRHIVASWLMQHLDVVIEEI